MSSPLVMFDADDEIITILTALEHAARHCRGYAQSPEPPNSKLAEQYDQLRGKLLVAAAVARGQAHVLNGAGRPNHVDNR